MYRYKYNYTKLFEYVRVIANLNLVAQPIVKNATNKFKIIIIRIIRQ